ncbi:MAG TPA: DUF2306 domain-containing protein [Thermoanaerobaculia bacterium]|nr:DUF2306 domain-containing protein [Thermoanaerobaculia bacterium]
MRTLGIVIRIAAIALALIGIVAAIARFVFPTDLSTRLEPTRAATLRQMSIVDAAAAQRPAEVRTFDGHFAAHLRTTLLHVGPGGVVLALMLLQFSRRIRNRYRRFHRWSGRVVVVGGLASGFAGLYFGVVKPFGGNPERVAALVFGGIFIVSIVRGFLLARRGDFDGHREWMIRAAAVAFGIATIRVFATIIDPLLAPFGWRMASVLVASLWSGWLFMVVAAELWIRATRPVQISAERFAVSVPDRYT